MPLIFISHASSDRPIIDDFFDLLQTGCDIRQDDIFCSSVDGAGIETGADFVEWIHDNLHRCDLAILFLTPNYYASRFCVAEMGAAWALEKDVFPLVVPDIPHEVGAVMLGRQTAVVDEIGLDHLRDRIARLFPQAGKGTARWSAKKEQFLEAFQEKFPNLPSPQPADLAELERQRQRLEAADQAIKKLREEKQQLRDQIKMLKPAKGLGEQADLRLLQDRFREIIQLQHQLSMFLSRVREGLQVVDSKTTGAFLNFMPAYENTYNQLRMTYEKWDLKASELLREYAPEQLERLTQGHPTIRDLVYLRHTCPFDTELWFRETENSLGEVAVLIQELGKELTASIPSELPYEFMAHFYDPSTQRHSDSPDQIRLIERAECGYVYYPAVLEHPPEQGDAVLTYRLRGLPRAPTEFRLSFRYGVLDKLYDEPSGALIEESDFLTVEGNRVEFSIRIDGEEKFRSPCYGHVWSPIVEKGPLGAPHGDLTIEFRTNAMGQTRGNWAAWGNPILQLIQIGEP